MNHFVPDFDTDDDYVHLNQNSSSLNLPRKSSFMGGGEDDLMELLWQNGQVVIQNQRHNNNNNNNNKPPSPVKLHGGGGGGGSAPPPPMHQQQPLDDTQNLFIQEDEMSSWLHYPLREDDFCSDFLFSGVASASAPQPQSMTRAAPPAAPITTPCASSTPERRTTSQVTAARPPAPSLVRPPVPSLVRPPVRNFMNFSRLRGDFTGGNGNGRFEPGPSISKAIVRESTLINPSATPSSTASESGISRRTVAIDSRETVNLESNSAVPGGGAYAFAVLEHNSKGKAVAAPPDIEIPGTSYSVASKSELVPVNKQPEAKKTIVDDRKRKEREAIDETECRNEETKQARGSTSSTKRSRAAEVHNLSERKRRDRINERMKALQELIPRCNKSDKASMLDEAIEYLKSLQLQVQMMSMGCGMMPMMYTGMQPYMPHHMAMGMRMGMNQSPPPRPTPAFMPFPNMLAAQRPFHASDPSRVYLPNQQSDPNLSQTQYQGYMDPYHQQFRSLQPTQPPQFQSQATSYPSSSRVSSSKESEEQGNHTTG